MRHVRLLSVSAVAAIAVLITSAPPPAPVVGSPAAQSAQGVVEYRPAVPVARDAVSSAADPVTRTERPASRTSARLSSDRRWIKGNWKRWGVRVETFAICVAKHESWHAGLWDAENPISSASGAFQFIDQTWQVMARRAGVRHVPRHASDASARKQARVMAYAVRTHQRFHWHGTYCPGT